MPKEGEIASPPKIGRIAIFLESGAIPEAAAKAIDYDGTAAELADEVEVDLDTTADAITLTARGRDGARAASLVDAYADATAVYFKKTRAAVGPVKIDIMSKATPLAEPIGGGFVIPPNRIVRASLASLLGLVVGIGLALMFG